MDVTLSTMLWLGCSIPAAAAGSSEMRIIGASIGRDVSGQTVTEAVESNRSS